MKQQRSMPFVMGRPELRRASQDAGSKVTLVGYAAKYNVESEEMWGFREMIAPGAFDGVLGDDVRALYNHDWNMVLGRSAAGTLRLSTDDVGLQYEVDLPNTTYARDLAESIERGDVNQSSFGFFIAMDGESWVAREKDVLRVITRVERLYDVSPVALPAYPDATVGVRGAEITVRSAYEAHQEALRAAEARAVKIRADAHRRAREIALFD